MVLEAVVFQQELFNQNSKELYSMASSGNPWLYDCNGMLSVEEEEENKGLMGTDLDLCDAVGGDGGLEIYREQENGAFLDNFPMRWDTSCSSLVQNFDDWDVNSSLTTVHEKNGMAVVGSETATATAVGGRRKRRRTKTCQNKEEVENQRMTHIAVERNRRKQMNEYLAVLRDLMPASYVQRGDQASIVGGAINFVKELEQQLQSLEAQKRLIQQSTPAASTAPPFADFFTFPQYSTCSSSSNATASISCSSTGNETVGAENRSTIADIEVTMVESHANLKVFCKRRPKQLLKIVVGLQNVGLTALHLNVTTIDEKALYSFSLKVEDDCQFSSVDEIAASVHQMLGRIQEEEVGAGFDHV